MKSFLKRLFGLNKSNAKGNSFPSHWNLTIADLLEEMKAGKRSEIKDPEMSWAREYERSLIPSQYRFPQKGDLYSARFDQEVSFITLWSAPYTGGGTTTLYKDEQIWVDADPIDKKPIGAYLLPVDYISLETRIVAESDKSSFKYEGFCFHIDTKTLNENFHLLETGFAK